MVCVSLLSSVMPISLCRKKDVLPSSALTIPWRPFYDLLSTLYFGKLRSSIEIHKQCVPAPCPRGPALARVQSIGAAATEDWRASCGVARLSPPPALSIHCPPYAANLGWVLPLPDARRC